MIRTVGGRIQGDEAQQPSNFRGGLPGQQPPKGSPNIGGTTGGPLLPSADVGSTTGGPLLPPRSYDSATGGHRVGDDGGLSVGMWWGGRDALGGSRDDMAWSPSAFQTPDPVHASGWAQGVAFGNQDMLPTTGAARFGVPNEGVVMPSAFAYPGSGGWVDSQGQHSGVAPRG